MFPQSARTGIVVRESSEERSDEVFAHFTTPGRILAGKVSDSLPVQVVERTAIDRIKKHPGSAQDGAGSAGNEQVAELAELYEQYKRPIHTYVYRLLGNQEDADDLTQEVFVRTFVSWADLTDHQHLSSWLYRIATNLCLDILRRRKRISWWPLTRRSPVQQGIQQVEEDAPYLPLDHGGIPAVFEREHIRLALTRVPADYAVVLVLSAAQGLTYQEIATIVGISPNAAATRISRAKKLFIEQYQRLNGEETGQKGEQE